MKRQPRMQAFMRQAVWVQSGGREGVMIHRRSRSWGWLVAPAVLLGLVGTALGAEASSAKYKFFGPTLVNGLYQCSKQYSVVNNTSKTAYGFVEAFSGSDCTTYYNRPAGYLGTRGVH